MVAIAGPDLQAGWAEQADAEPNYGVGRSAAFRPRPGVAGIGPHPAVGEFPVAVEVGGQVTSPVEHVDFRRVVSHVERRAANRRDSQPVVLTDRAQVDDEQLQGFQVGRWLRTVFRPGLGVGKSDRQVQADGIVDLFLAESFLAEMVLQNPQVKLPGSRVVIESKR